MENPDDNELLFPLGLNLTLKPKETMDSEKI